MSENSARVKVPSAVGTLFGALLAFTSNAQNPPRLVPPLESLTYSGSFDVDARGLAIQDFWADARGLYFLLRASGVAEVLHTDNTGREITRFPVYQPGFSVREIRRNTLDEIAILETKVNSSKLAVYRASDGILLRENDFVERIDHLAPLTDGAFAFYRERDNTIVWGASSHATVLSPNSKRDTLFLTGPGNKLSLVERSSGRLSRIQPNEELREFQLHGPEIDGVLRANYADPDITSIIIIAAYSDEAGQLWVSTSPYSPKQGAIILSFDESGALVKRFRCSLPIYDALRGRPNPTGQMGVSFIAKRSGLLFVVSSLGAHCAFYQITD